MGGTPSFWRDRLSAVCPLDEWHEPLRSPPRDFSTSPPLQNTLGWIRSHNPVIIAVTGHWLEKVRLLQPWQENHTRGASSQLFLFRSICSLCWDASSSREMLRLPERVWKCRGIRAHGSRRPIVSQRCLGPDLQVESARHWLQSQQTVRVERQLWLWLIRLYHLPSDWWRRVWEWSHYQLYLARWL